MHLVYLDESGNTGLNLNDPQQPLFLLCAMIVEESKWHSLEEQLKGVIDRFLPEWKWPERFEIHGSDLRTGNGHFNGIPASSRIQFRDEWMHAGAAHGVKLVARSVHKKRYSKWLVDNLGHGVHINPHIAAFALLSRSVDNYLKSLPGSQLGIFVCDDNKEVAADVEKSIATLRISDGALRLSRIVEKGFFIDSTKSLPLQLCDLFALSLRKSAEILWMEPTSRSFDASGIAIAESLLFRDNKHDQDVLKWLTENHSGKKRSGQG